MAKQRQYHSIYGTAIIQLITLKRKLGFKYTTAASILGQIDQFALQRNETTVGISKVFADAWQEKRSHESSQCRYDRVRVLVQLSSYLSDTGIPSYIPRIPQYKPADFIPYIFTSSEIHNIFEALDRLQLKLRLSKAALMCIPAFIRLLYATGLRIGEAIEIKRTDIDLEHRHLRVTDSKNGKQRIIPIDKTLVEVCSTYIEYRKLLPISKSSDYFFVKLDGQKLSNSSVNHWFKEALLETGIAQNGNIKNGVRQSPRIHDLRHTFAVTSLASMAQAGLDLYVALPILSNYLGHQSIKSTDRYVRLTHEYYPDVIKQMDMLCVDVFPSFNNYQQGHIEPPSSQQSDLANLKNETYEP